MPRPPPRRGPRPAARPPAAALDAELAIAALAAQGDGLAPGPVYVPLTLPGERVAARIEGDRAEVLAVLQASPERVTPPCPHFGACGGCALQHWAHGPYLAWKVGQIAQVLARERIETEILPAFAAAPGTRRRLALHARPFRRDEAALGYKARRSWRQVEIQACPIADPRLVAALPVLRRLAAPLFEHPKSAPTLHVTLTETGLDVDVTGVERKSGGLSADARVRLAEVAGAGDLARVTLGGGETLYQSRSPVVRFGRASVALPPGGFLQAVAGAEAAMAAFAVQAVSGAGLVADLFCGAGAFAFRLAEQSPVIALDSEAPAIAALKAALGGAGVKPITAEARDLFRRPLLAAEMKRVEAVVFDPPRAGAEAQAREIAASKVARVVGVSCNAATFARDAAILIAGGFTLDRLLPVDQFLWSPHIELAGVFSR